MASATRGHIAGKELAEFRGCCAVQCNDALQLRSRRIDKLRKEQHTCIIYQHLDAQPLHVVVYLLGRICFCKVGIQRLGHNAILARQLLGHANVILLTVADNYQIPPLGSQLARILSPDTRRAARYKCVVHRRFTLAIRADISA